MASPVTKARSPQASEPNTPERLSWETDATVPQSEAIEDSILLRVLAQAMVLVGIAAMDVAVDDVRFQLSYWAIPLSIAGATWSWFHRRKRNIAVKFILAILMLAALGNFFVQLRQFSDTRLALAQLLVQVQVLHTFDLPRRKDLGYSVIIGLILIGVASTLSQTMVFGGLLLIFLAIALPVMVLDYRSRLGLLGQQIKSLFKTSGLSPKRLGLFFVIIVSLGLLIFAAMPRLPGYQLRTFPVSEQLQTPADFDGRNLVNPGYMSDGNPEGGTGGANVGEQGLGPGELDETFYYGFNTRMNQNLRGEMEPVVVMRVRSQSPGYWRVMAFDRYLGQGWEISRNDQSRTIDRPRWMYQFRLPVPPTLNKTREVVQTYTITEDLPNIIPALSQPKELYFPTAQIGLDLEGALRSPLALIDGLTYTVISKVPYRDRTALRESPTNYSDTLREIYMQVPDAIRPKVRQKAQELLDRSENPITDPYETALFLAQALKQNYTIQPNMPFLGNDEDLVEAFLFRYEGGYPDHFSTVLTIMLRSLGIPARLAVGFAPGEFNPFTGLYEVKNTDAYAVTEVYFPKYGWFAFDPIPGHDLYPPSIEENQTFSVLQQFWNWVAGWVPSPVSSFFTRIFGTIVSWVMGIVGWFVGLFARGWLGIFVAIGSAIALAFGLWLSWQGWRAWRYQRWLARRHPIEQLYRHMLDWLATQGHRKQPAQTPLEYAHHLAQQPAYQHTTVVEDITHAYINWRYGGQAAPIEPLAAAFQNLKRQRWRPGRR